MEVAAKFKSPIEKVMDGITNKDVLKLELKGEFEHKCDFPQQISHLNLQQFELLAQYYFMPDLLRPLYQCELLRVLMGMEKESFLQLDAETIKDLIECINPLIERPIYPFSFYPNFVWNKREFDGLTIQFTHMILDEYIYADAKFNHYLKNRNSDDLNCLVALLLRPKTHAFQHEIQTQGFDAYGMIEKDHIKQVELIFADKKKKKKGLDLFERSGLARKHGILLNYLAQRNFVARRYQRTFGGSGDGSSQQDWRKSTVLLAGTELGTVDMVRKSLAHDVFTLMEAQLERLKK